jgi:hypothetical protein
MSHYTIRVPGIRAFCAQAWHAVLIAGTATLAR